MRNWFLLAVAFATLFAFGETSLNPLKVEAKLGMNIEEPVIISMVGKYSYKKIPVEEYNNIQIKLEGSRAELRQALRKIAIEKNVGGFGVNGTFDYRAISLSENASQVLVDFHKQIHYSDQKEIRIIADITPLENDGTDYYQMIYEGPGVIYHTGYIANYFDEDNEPLPGVNIECQIMKTNMIKSLRVVLTNNASEIPKDVITESQEGNPDINAGFSVGYGFLYPTWTNFKEEAATSIEFHTVPENEPVESSDDIIVLPLGVEGVTSYLKIIRTDIKNRRIARVGLLRDFPSNEYCTDNFNKDRGGKTLFLCWELHRAED